MFAQNAQEYFSIPKMFRKEPVVVVPVVEAPIQFCEDQHFDDLGEIIERNETVYNVFASIVEHTTAWA